MFLPWIGALCGACLVLLATMSIVNALLIPRGRMGPILRGADRLVTATFRAVTSRIASYERRDTLLAAHAPAVIMGQLLIWLSLYALGFGLLLWPSVPNLEMALSESVSSMLTLGFRAPTTPWATVVDAFAALAGLTSVAMQIGYLPTLYGAYNRRETEITLLAVRAGEPAWGPELLARTHYGFHGGDLGAFYAAWERWSADIAESHTSYPVLLRFRSPRPDRSWVIALLAVLDAAAMHTAISPGSAPVEARLALRMGFTCLRQLAATMNISVPDDPRPDDPIELTEAEFQAAYERVERVGFPVERDSASAWAHFKGWRVNYELAAYALAREVDAVPARWSGPRHSGDTHIDPVRPPNRTPEAPDNPDQGRIIVS